MAGPYSSVRHGGHRETEAPISRAELHHFENSFLEAMERMFDKRFPAPLGHHAPQQHSPTTTYGGMLGRSGQHGGGARGHSPRPCVLNGAEDASTKRKIQRESAKQLRVIQKNSEGEFPQPHKTPQPQRIQKPGKEGLVMMARKGDLKELSVPNAKMSEKEDKSCEELFTSNILISSSSCVSCVMQACEEKDVVNYDQPPIFDEEDQMMVMDRAAALSLFNMQHQVQIEDNTNAYPSTSSGATSTTSVEVSAHDCFASIAALILLEDTVKYDIYEYIAPLDIEVIVHQNPCER
jgi:hypothetical protein